MKRSLISALGNAVGTEVKICGWVQTIRSRKKMQFLIIRDHTGIMQVVHERTSANDNLASLVENLTLESAVEIIGTVLHNDHVKLNQIEVVLNEIVIHGPSLPQMPVQKKSNLDLRLDWRFLDLRFPENLLIFKIQTTAERAMRNFWNEHGFIEIHSPKLMGSASESGAELFQVDYFGGKAYLAQSPQFYKQMAMAAGFDRVFEIGPVFRANPSFTSRHDTEFTSIDVEVSWINSHEDIMALEENWLKYIINAINVEHGTEINTAYGVDIIVPSVPFPRLTLDQAHAILAENNYVMPTENKGDLDSAGEQIIGRHVRQKYGHEFVFLTEYSTDVRPFYHMRIDSNQNSTKSFDLLWKGLEVTTGAQREHRYNVLVNQAQEKGLKLETIEYYLNCFRYGCPPHGGYGFGLTRMLMVLLNIKNVREVTYLYRGPTRLMP